MKVRQGSLVVIVVGGLLLGLLIGPYPGTIAQEGQPRIAFINADWHLYLMNADGTQPVQVADRSGLLYPSWSPDGSTIVAIDTRPEIITLDTASGEVRQLTHNDTKERYPAYSPDGTRIAFASDRDAGWEIYLMDADGSHIQRLTYNDAANGYNGLAWSADGNTIAFVRDGGITYNETTGTYEQQNIYLLDVDLALAEQSEYRPLNLTERIDRCPAGAYYYSPTWSFSTNQLAFAVSCGGDAMDIYLMNMTGVPDTLLTPTDLTRGEFRYQAGYRGLSWSPVGDRLAFITFIDDETRSSEIVVLDVTRTLAMDAVVATQITDAPEDAIFRGLAWQPAIPPGDSD